MNHPDHAASWMGSGPLLPELSSPESLARRLARVPPGDRARGYLFQATLEQVRLRGGDEAVRRCLEASGEKELVAFFKYPFASMLRMTYQATWELMGPASFEATLYGLGWQVCEHFLGNSVGRSFLLMAGKNPRQMVESLPVVYRTGWDHGWVSLQWLGPHHCRATLREAVLPSPYLEGILHRMFETVGVVRPHIKSRSVSLSETEFEMSWPSFPELRARR